jgi:hypothetical protein
MQNEVVAGEDSAEQSAEGAELLVPARHVRALKPHRVFLVRGCSMLFSTRGSWKAALANHI